MKPQFRPRSLQILNRLSREFDWSDARTRQLANAIVEYDCAPMLTKAWPCFDRRPYFLFSRLLWKTKFEGDLTTVYS